MLPVFKSLGVATSGSAGTQFPWGTHASGDVALLGVEVDGNRTVTLTTPEGFTLIGSTGAGTGADKRLYLYWCRATSSSMASPTLTPSSGAIYGRTAVYEGCIATGDPFDVWEP